MRKASGVNVKWRECLSSMRRAWSMMLCVVSTRVLCGEKDIVRAFVAGLFFVPDRVSPCVPHAMAINKPRQAMIKLR